ncbi:class I SAM-dependent methyltransferase [Phytomonospora endophytica]|uniref:SAM-dependent methyltransferase n=1 Tax=Phytomonospora endophytica TaxID=714109 RepID=A0A841FGL0_9ACTN|nr:class I SAM-dependent methyltransferase [Phytomonospora endophytica]MBB6032227.1 SAM-dependent methyltransferase [Phytomonospora endophytica]GIG68576.1 methyltransferase [Phytomonospora endophytica]
MYETLKTDLIASLSGTVLEIGAGTGRNFPHLSPGAEWIGLEPDRRLHAKLQASASRHARPNPRILPARAESIPLADESVDAVVSTVVLCSVDDQSTALAEVSRVLRPGGRLVFFEHVAAPRGTWTRRLQRAWAPFSRRFDRGCDPVRDTASAIERAEFAFVEFRRFAMPTGLGPTVPFIAGYARR